MSLTIVKSDTGATFRPRPAGTWPARCVQLLDLGSQQSTFEGQTRTARKVLVGFEVCDPEGRCDEWRAVWPLSIGAADQAAVLTGHEWTVEGSPEAWVGVYRELIAA